MPCLLATTCPWQSRFHTQQGLPKAQGLAERGRWETGQKLLGITRNKVNAHLCAKRSAVHFRSYKTSRGDKPGYKEQRPRYASSHADQVPCGDALLGPDTISDAGFPEEGAVNKGAGSMFPTIKNSMSKGLAGPAEQEGARGPKTQAHREASFQKSLFLQTRVLRRDNQASAVSNIRESSPHPKGVHEEGGTAAGRLSAGQV